MKLRGSSVYVRAAPRNNIEYGLWDEPPMEAPNSQTKLNDPAFAPKKNNNKQLLTMHG